MEETILKQQEGKAFDIALAEDTIVSLNRKIDELIYFITSQSIDCCEGECRKKVIETKGQAWFINYLIEHGCYDYLKEEDWNFISQKINS